MRDLKARELGIAILLYVEVEWEESSVLDGAVCAKDWFGERKPIFKRL